MITLRNTKTNALLKIKEAINWHDIKDIGYAGIDAELFANAKNGGMKIYFCSINGIAIKDKFSMSPNSEKPIDLVDYMIPDGDSKEDWSFVNHESSVNKSHISNVIQFPFSK